MVESVGIEDWIDKNGNPCRNTDSLQSDLISRNSNHCQFAKFENASYSAVTPAFGYACDRKIAVQTVTISRFFRNRNQKKLQIWLSIITPIISLLATRKAY